MLSLILLQRRDYLNYRNRVNIFLMLLILFSTIRPCLAPEYECNCEPQIVYNITQEIIQEPTETVIDETIPTEPEPVLINIGIFTCTAYCACSKCCGSYSNGITANGSVATEGVTVAADISVLPFDTAIIIDGNEYIVQDTGVRGNHIDIFFNDHQEALNFGVQHKEVYIYGESSY